MESIFAALGCISFLFLFLVVYAYILYKLEVMAYKRNKKAYEELLKSLDKLAELYKATLQQEEVLRHLEAQNEHQ